jgi:hypothetical protein
MVTTEETTVKVSKWLVGEVERYVAESMRNKTEFPSKRNFVDKAIIEFLERRKFKLRG